MTASRGGYFQAIKEWSKHPQRFLGQPKIPKYKDKTKAPNVVIYSNVARIDLGIDRLVALATNKPDVKPLLVNGKPLKSVNQL